MKLPSVGHGVYVYTYIYTYTALHSYVIGDRMVFANGAEQFDAPFDLVRLEEADRQPERGLAPVLLVADDLEVRAVGQDDIVLLRQSTADLLSIVGRRQGDPAEVAAVQGRDLRARGHVLLERRGQGGGSFGIDRSQVRNAPLGGTTTQQLAHDHRVQLRRRAAGDIGATLGQLSGKVRVDGLVVAEPQPGRNQLGERRVGNRVAERVLARSRRGSVEVHHSQRWRGQLVCRRGIVQDVVHVIRDDQHVVLPGQPRSVCAWSRASTCCRLGWQTSECST